MVSSASQKAPKGKAPARDKAPSAGPDARFASFQTDPRYRLPSKKHAKVRLDSRFSRMLSDGEFHRQARVDRYGRQIQSDKGKRDLERLYKLDNEASLDEVSEDDERKADSGAAAPDSGEDDEVVERELQRLSQPRKKSSQGYDPARQGGFSSSSDSDSSSDGEEQDDEGWNSDLEEAEVFGPTDQAAVPNGEVTRRIAVVNLDWDNVRAADLMAVASSFNPAEGRIEGVDVYPSEFGRDRMEREEIEGPPAEIFAPSDSLPGPQDVQDEPSDGSKRRHRKTPQTLQPSSGATEYDSTALRRYQLDRLRYYYAVIRCSSTDVAQALYHEMDGREYLSTANFFDLRFIPDDVSFEDDKPRDSCDKVPEGYRPNEFVTDALQHSKVRLTWDEDDQTRKDVQKRAFGRAGMDVEENDMLAYIASASSEDETDAEEDELIGTTVDRFGVNAPQQTRQDKRKTHDKGDRAQALRAALGLEGDKRASSSLFVPRSRDEGKPSGNLQVTFTAGLSEAQGGSVFENEPEESTRDKYIRQERERKARRRAKGKDTVNGEVLSDTGPRPLGSSGDPALSAGDGFNDPFFEDPEAANREALRKARKDDKRRLKEERAAEQQTAARQRAELELLMTEEEATHGRSVRHFDINEIAKEEKQRKRAKKGKKAKLDLTDPTREMGGDTASLAIDVKDPRFAKVFESHEYAIDPNDPRFKGTEGMKAFLEEGRRRRVKKRDREETAPDNAPGDTRKKPKGGPEGDKDLGRLLHKVRSRAVHT